MSEKGVLRTNAIPDDFPHLLAWFGKTPSFEFVKNRKAFHCRDEWFKFRQLVDMRYYANFVYTEHENYNLKTIMKRIEDISVCRKIKKIDDDEERVIAYRNWFEKRRYPVNDVWEYKEPPKLLRGK
jgi:hypothetical protein